MNPAAALPVPGDVPLKGAKDFKWIGKALTRFDTPAKVDGSATFGIDVKPRQKRLERNRRGDIPALLREHFFERRLGLERRGERVTPVDLEGAGQPRLQSRRRRRVCRAPAARRAWTWSLLPAHFARRARRSPSDP